MKISIFNIYVKWQTHLQPYILGNGVAVADSEGFIFRGSLEAMDLRQSGLEGEENKARKSGEDT